MKDFLKISAMVLMLLAFVGAIIYECNKPKAEVVWSSKVGFGAPPLKVIKVENCEYTYLERGAFTKIQHFNGCKNPIHKKTIEVNEFIQRPK